jgi:F0F1-type ATP synthase assembly protein I
VAQFDDNSGEKLAEGLRKNVTKDFGPFLSMGIQLAAAVVIFFFVGYWLDGKLKTYPWLSITGALLGSVGGMVKFIREAQVLGKKADEELKEIEKHKREGR